MPVGIDDISFYTTNFSLDLQELADNNGPMPPNILLV